MRISVVIPCYNEEGSIGGVINSLPQGVNEVVVIDNNCTDQTVAVATAKGAVVIKESKSGYGAAIKAGLAVATCEIIVVLDGDSQYPGNKVVEVAEYLEKNNIDFISCSRFPLADKKIMSAKQKIGNFLLTLVANVLFLMRMKDSLSGMWVFRREILESIHLKSDSSPFSAEIKIRVAKCKNCKFAEYHIDYFPRCGITKLSTFKHGFLCLFSLFKLRWELFFR